MNTAAEILSIGDELLIGQVINTNASWMATELNLRGIPVHQISVISDQREHILTALKEAGERTRLVLITGGLGPTKDDITKSVLCEYFNTTLEFNDEAFSQVEALFRQRGFVVSEVNR